MNRKWKKGGTDDARVFEKKEGKIIIGISFRLSNLLFSFLLATHFPLLFRCLSNLQNKIDLHDAMELEIETRQSFETAHVEDNKKACYVIEFYVF